MTTNAIKSQNVNMIPTNIEQIEGIAEAISTLGVGHKKACVLAYLLTHGNVKQHDIERAMDLRQPEVSNYLKEFSTRKWVGISDTVKQANAKGRSSNVYNLIKEPSVIARELRDTYINRKRIDESVRMISKVERVE